MALKSFEALVSDKEAVQTWPDLTLFMSPADRATLDAHGAAEEPDTLVIGEVKLTQASSEETLLEIMGRTRPAIPLVALLQRSGMAERIRNHRRGASSAIPRRPSSPSRDSNS